MADDQHAATLAEGQAWARAGAAGEVEGLFGPDSPAWTVGRELALMAAGGRALVLQLANPVVAEGVDANSHFRRHLLQRARRTFTQVYSIFFGDLTTALGAGARAHAMHRAVQGVIRPATCPARAGEPYTANDPVHLVWVWATLCDSSRLAYEEMIQPMTPAFRAAWYRQFRLFAGAMGVPERHVPADFPAFQAWWDAMLASDRLYVGDTMRALCLSLFRSPITAGQLDETLAIGWLPDRLREAVPATWDAGMARRHRLAVDALGAGLRRAPSAIRFAPAWHQAMLRVHTARGTPATLWSRALDQVDRWVDVPFSLR